MNLRQFFMNSSPDTKQGQVVEAPAFSLTKVMAVAAPVITAVVTVALAGLRDIEFRSGQVVTLIVALIAFLALTGSSDVLARAIATAAEKRSAHLAKRGPKPGTAVLHKPLPAKLILTGQDEDVQVLAASTSDPATYLCLRADNTAEWLESKDLRWR